MAKILVIYENDGLPFGCFGTYREAAAAIGMTKESLMTAVSRRSGRIKDGRTAIRVEIDEEEAVEN